MLLSHWLSPLCSIRQTASRLAIKICDKLKFLWALPTPTTFEKVDQTFIFGTETFSFAVLCYPTDTPPNYNLPQLLIKNRQNTRKKAVPNLRNCLFIKSSINVLGFCFFSFYRRWCRSYIFDCLFALFLFNNIDINANCHKACKAHR